MSIGVVEEVVVLLDRLPRWTVVFHGNFGLTAARRRRCVWLVGPLVYSAVGRGHVQSKERKMMS